MYTTKQEIFDIVVRGLAAQGFERSGFQSEEGKFVCEYRDLRGLKCAAGHLIPDSMYTPALEGLTFGASFFTDEDEKCSKGQRVTALTRLRVALGLEENSELLAFACEMQRMHDESATPELMKLKFGRLAEHHGLATEHLPLGQVA